MPLSENEDTNKLASELVDTFRATFHTPKTDRPAHAHGQFVKGLFTPGEAASSLSTAKIFSEASTPVVARFSSATGIPDIQDNNLSANPRGFAIRFLLSEDGHKHYDIILHSANGFLVRTGEELKEFFDAQKNGTVDDFLAKHSHAADFVSKNPGFPQSFASEQYYGVNAFKFVNGEGKETWFRSRIVPANGEVTHYTQGEANAKGKDYLYNELNTHLSSSPMKFKLLAQIATPEDPLDDATKVWPESRDLIELGTLTIDTIWNPVEGSEDAKFQKRIIMDPVPRMIEGIEAGVDPLIDLRATVYIISGKIRREAGGVA